MKTNKHQTCTLRKKPVKNGYSLYLDIYSNGKRRYETLNLYLLDGTSREVKAENANTLRLAEAIQAKRTTEILNKKAGIFNEDKGEILFIDFLEGQKKSCTSTKFCGIRNVTSIIKKYDKGTRMIDIDKDYILNMIKWLYADGRSNNTAANYFRIINNLFNIAVADKYIFENPIKFLRKEEKPITEDKSREYLTIEELKLMEANTDGIREGVVKQFLFSCYCGLRVSDIQNLKWNQIQRIENNRMQIALNQKKTKALLYLPLNTKALEFLPDRGINDPDNAPIFEPLQAKTLNFWVHRWSENCGISKYVTFHTARHTFATTLLTKQTDIYTIQKLMGHKSISSTQIYATMLNSTMQNAVDTLNDL